MLVEVPEAKARKLTVHQPLPARIQPQLSLGEEVTLLARLAPRRKVRRAVALAAEVHGAPTSHRDAQRSLARKGLVRRSLRGVQPLSDARIGARESRVLDVIRLTSPLPAQDAELLVLLAFSGALRLNFEDHLRARHRISAIGTHDSMPPVVELVRRARRCKTMRELAEALLPSEQQFRPGGFDPGVTAGAEAGAGYTTTGPGPQNV